ncbi:LAME_0C02300g1_1 [Lachancea meyersii CBS 8951]|uniref:LAME_0C02300g1_1 n=1 Tax=Lachancea meyersii CBS 8951 TaxID=1266667 RepID=A0A1G4IZE6_9SACH|nr:LAME_0C02300g1_1 [Lachancea meyersii CBS 8951]
MSLLIVDMRQVRLLAAKNRSELGMERLRVIGQCIGIRSHQDDADKMQLMLQNVKELNHDCVACAEISVGEENRSSGCWTDGTLVEGSVCDVRCCIIEGRVEAMDVRVWSLGELKTFKEFWHSDVGQRWRRVSEDPGTS